MHQAPPAAPVPDDCPAASPSSLEPVRAILCIYTWHRAPHSGVRWLPASSALGLRKLRSATEHHASQCLGDRLERESQQVLVAQVTALLVAHERAAREAARLEFAPDRVERELSDRRSSDWDLRALAEQGDPRLPSLLASAVTGRQHEPELVRDVLACARLGLVDELRLVLDIYDASAAEWREEGEQSLVAAVLLVKATASSQAMTADM